MLDAGGETERCPKLVDEQTARDLASQQAALRRVATLVAEGVGSDELFAAVACEVADVVGIPLVGLHRFEGDGTFTMIALAGATSFTVGSRWPIGEGVVGIVLATGRPARKDDYATMAGPLGAAARDDRTVGTIGVPIVVEGKIWGAIVGVARPGKPIPDGTEERLAGFTELVATAIANSQAREYLAQLAEEQAALRRVATLVARQAPQPDIFSAIAEECVRVFGTPATEMFRYDGDSTVVVASTGRFRERFSVGSRHPLGGENISTQILQTGSAARIDDYQRASGPIGEAAIEMGLRSALGAPIIVDGELWGALIMGTTAEAPLPSGTEARLGEFTGLMATAIANTESRAKLERLADEQESLRRVATLVARESSPAAVFAAVTDEARRVLELTVGLLRFEPDNTATLVAQSETPWPPPPLGTRLRLDGENLVTEPDRVPRRRGL